MLVNLVGLALHDGGSLGPLASRAVHESIQLVQQSHRAAGRSVGNRWLTAADPQQRCPRLRLPLRHSSEKRKKE